MTKLTEEKLKKLNINEMAIATTKLAYGMLLALICYQILIILWSTRYNTNFQILGLINMITIGIFVIINTKVENHINQKIEYDKKQKELSIKRKQKIQKQNPEIIIL